MKNKQQEQAKELYFQTNMSKTDIAQQVGVSRRTVLRWCSQDNWEVLRRSSRHLPALVAEKCYYIIDIYASRLLQDTSLCSLTLKDAQTIHLLASSIKKLKNRSTINESMEMFNFFLDGLHRKDPQLAAKVMPEMEEYIEARRAHGTNDFLLNGFKDGGTMPFPEKEGAERYEDEKDFEALNKEIENTPGYAQALKNWEEQEPAHNTNKDKQASCMQTVGSGNIMDNVKDPLEFRKNNVPPWVTSALL